MVKKVEVYALTHKFDISTKHKDMIITTKTLNAFEIDFKKAIEVLEKKYDVKLANVRISYSSESFTVKSTLSNTTVKNGKEVTVVSERDRKIAAQLGYPEIGSTKIVRGQKFEIIGYNFRAPKFPLIGRNIDGKEFRLTHSNY